MGGYSSAFSMPASRSTSVWPAPGKAFGQDVGAEQHHRAHIARGERGANAGRVATHEIDLQVGQVVERDRDIRELAEPGGHPVDDVPSRDDGVDHVPRLLHPSASRCAQRHPGARGDRPHILDGQ